MVHFFEDERIKDALKRVSIKNVKEGFGHDLAGYFCDFYLDGKKMGYVNNDGWGGEVEPVFDNSEKEATFNRFLADNNIAQVMFETDWAFVGSAEKITPSDQTNSIVEFKLGEKEQEKNDKKFQKAMKKAMENSIVFGTNNSFKSRGYKISLKMLVEKHGEKGFAAIQKLYDEIKSNLAKDERILNDNLQELGIKL